MDQVKENDEAKEQRELLRELLKIQELVLHRLDRIEEAIRNSPRS
ncbi:MAG: hypothetical protein M0042_08845 [Nitrospiraceae bacterium]|nr:hypothetical protein [Nitrospiraceae bacterium]